MRSVPIPSPAQRERGAGGRGEGSPPRVAIHPGSGGRRKNWPAERFAEVAAALLADGHGVVGLAGPAGKVVLTAE